MVSSLLFKTQYLHTEGIKGRVKENEWINVGVSDNLWLTRIMQFI